MLTRAIWSTLLSGALLVGGGLTEVDAQLRQFGVTAYSGASIPIGQFAEYMTGGPTFGLQVEYPIREPIDLFLTADLDKLNGNSSFGMPDIDLYRYQAGIEADVLGRGSDRWGLRGQLGAGATRFTSASFFLYDGPTTHRFKQTYFSGTAGLKLVFGSGPLQGYLGSRLHWAPMKEAHTQVLREKSFSTLAALDTSLSVPVSLGLRVRTS
jgi:hypothetical protein